ncbi:MAG: PAS domain-containing protein [Puniceicoccales bacterium]|nr:PAS domain-containing protein [Puniceicoccales bacterium]
MVNGGASLGNGLFGCVLAALSDGLAVVDCEGLIHYLNQRARELIGIADDEKLPLPLRRHGPEFFIHLRECLLGSTAEILEISVSYPEQRLLRVNCLPISSAAGQLHALVISDRTGEEECDSKKRDDDACAAVELIAGTMAHELGNCLNVMQIHLQLLGRQLKPTAKAMETVNICRSEAERMHRLISNFLGVIRPAKTVLRSINLNDVLRDCIAVQRIEMAQRSITVSTKFCQEPPPLIAGDGEQLRQVFFNLLRNAMEAIEGAGTIAIEIVDEGAFVRVDMRDSGVGIDPSAMANFFRPQWSGKRDGNGLGLLLARRILRAHGATISLRGLSPNGTCATVRFPLKNPKFPMLEGLDGRAKAIPMGLNCEAASGS